MGTMDQLRHAEERGKLLKALQEEYSGRMTRVATLRAALDLLGFPMSDVGIQFHLQYLADEGYISVQRAHEAAAYRRDRGHAGGDPNVIVWARLMPRGVRLIDGIEAENPGVRF